jgi:hypothetical protein
VKIGGAEQRFGVRGDVARNMIGNAYKAFVANEANSVAAASAFADLLYDSPIGVPNAPTPPLVGGQYFGICDPNDMLASLTGNYGGTTTDALSTYWDSTLTAFFKIGSYLSINLSANPTDPNIYSGKCSTQTNPKTGVASPAYTLSKGATSYTYYMPLASGQSLPGLTGAQYVFQQAFGDLTPAGAADDAGLLQDCIWEALCRGVGPAGVSATAITSGESTTAWNTAANWYKAGNVSHVYAKFLHCSDVDGNDYRVVGTDPILFGGAAYGFSMDETPIGPYSGPNVPFKTTQNVPDGSTVTITVGPWAAVPA